MTPERRNEIFSKEVITTADLAELLEINRTYASICMFNIKQNSDRLSKITGETIKGKCHIQDYLDFFSLETVPERYGKYSDKPIEIRTKRPEDFQKRWNLGSVCEYREN